VARKKVQILSVKSAKKLIDIIAAASVFLKDITVKATLADSGNIRILDMQQYGLKLTTRYNQVSFDYDQGFNIPFACKEIVYPTVLSDSDLEDMELNPEAAGEGKGADGTSIATMLGKIFGADYHDMILNGDTDLALVADPDTPAEYRQNMLRQVDGYIAQLDTASRVIKSATHDTIKKEIAALYAKYAEDDLITTSTKMYMGQADYLAAWQAVTSTTKDLIIKDNVLYYITTEIKPISRMNHLLIGDPAAMQVRIKREIGLETQRSIEHRGYKYLMGLRADAIFVKELFRALEHTSA
jgi:hypothetical protein